MSGCPRHPAAADRACYDYRCQRTWKPEGAPSVEDQLTMWVLGASVCPNEAHECCPDFSCCKPELKWPQEKRRKYQLASQGEREKMCMGAIESLVTNSTTEKVYITRGDPKDND